MIGLWQAEQRVTCIDSWSMPLRQHPSLRYIFAGVSGGWNWGGFGTDLWGGLGLVAQRQPEGAGCGVAQPGVAWKKPRSTIKAKCHC